MFLNRERKNPTTFRRMLAMSVQQARMGTPLGQLMRYLDRMRQQEPRENRDTDWRRNAPSTITLVFTVLLRQGTETTVLVNA